MSKTVVCKNPKGYKLTKGKEYPYTAKRNGYFYIVNDNGKKVKYYEDLFDKPKVIREAKPVPKKDTMEQILNTAGINLNTNGNGGHRIYFTMDGRRISFNASVSMNLDSSISCGIKQVSGLNGLANSIVNGTPNNVPNRANFMRHLYSKIISTVVDACSAGLVIMSTNTNAGNYSSVINCLDDIADQSIETHNPNSGNRIKMWTFDLSESEDTADSDWDED